MTDRVTYRFRVVVPVVSLPETGSPAGPPSSEVVIEREDDDEARAKNLLQAILPSQPEGSHGELWRIRTMRRGDHATVWGRRLQRLHMTSDEVPLWVAEDDPEVEVQSLTPPGAAPGTVDLRKIIAALERLDCGNSNGVLLWACPHEGGELK